MKQFAKNACGSIAVFHVLGNLPLNLNKLIKPESSLLKFFQSVKSLDPKESGELFMKDMHIRKKHSNAVKSGETKEYSDNAEEEDYHFIAFVPKEGYIIELDGLRKRANNCKKIENENWMIDAMEIVKGYMNRDPDNNGFSMIALAKIPSE